MKGRKGEGRMEGKKESHEGFNTQVRNISDEEEQVNAIILITSSMVVTDAGLASLCSLR